MESSQRPLDRKRSSPQRLQNRHPAVLQTRYPTETPRFPPGYRANKTSRTPTRLLARHQQRYPNHRFRLRHLPEVSPKLTSRTTFIGSTSTFAFQDTSMDIFAHNGNHYLVYVDRLSGWPVIASFPNRNLKTLDVISVLRHCFMTYGVPSRIRSDGGLQFASSEFANFAATWNFTHVMSSPHHPKSNGHAEAAVKAMKRLLQKASPSGVLNSDTFVSGLLEWRNTPNSDGLSQAQVLFGHQLRSQIPSHTTNFKTNPSNNSRDRASFQRKTNKAAKLRHDVHAHTLPLIPVGTRVRVQHPLTKLWDTTGTIISSNKKRDYRIMMSSGRIYWRNRRYVRPTTPGHYQTHESTSNSKQSPESSKRTPTSTTSSHRHPTRTLEPPRRSARLARHTSLRPTIPCIGRCICRLF